MIALRISYFVKRISLASWQAFQSLHETRFTLSNKMMQKFLLTLLILASCFAIFNSRTLNLQKLSVRDQQTLDSILTKTNALLEARKAINKNPNWIEISDLKHDLSWKEKHLIEKILKLKPADLNARTPSQSVERVKVAYKTLTDQPVMKEGQPLEFLTPIVSMPVYEAYEQMMRAMEKDLGKRLYIESGHRSLGYHLFNFLKYLREHNYSLLETGKLNALPGYSEHNLWHDHAIDLINAEGINGEPKVEDYENLPEHQWMLKHAGEYGFTLSYPRGNPFGISFEPWHWRRTKTNG